MTAWWIAALSAFWFGVLTSISPCPLATNITAISFIGRRAGSARGVLLAGGLYTIGRAVVYAGLGALLVGSLLSAPQVSLVLQTWMNKILGPILILVGMVMLDLLRLAPRGRGIGERMQRRVEGWGLFGAFALGALFALSFCPVSASLYFGSLIPLAIARGSRLVLPFLFGVGTALPVAAVACVLAFGASQLGKFFDRMTVVERWVRRITGVVFVGVGIYLSLVHIYKVL